MFKKWMAVLLTVTLLLATGLTALPICGNTPLYGDVNRDGSVDMKDVLLLRKYIAGIGLDVDRVAADVNGDDSVDMKDVLLMRKYIANLIAEFPVGARTSSEDPSIEPSGTISGEPSETSAADSEDESIPDRSDVSPEDPSAEDPSAEDSSVEDPSAEDPSVEDPSAEDPSVEDPSVEPVEWVTLTVNVTEESPRYNTRLVSAGWLFQKGSTATFTVTMSIYRADTDRTVDQLKSYVALTDAALQGDPTVGARGTGDGSQECLITYTYMVIMDGDITVTGTIANPNYRPATIESAGESIGESSEGSSDDSEMSLPEGVVYDADVTGTLTLAPGAVFRSADLTAAFETYTTLHGVAGCYVVTATASVSPADTVYPILLGADGAEIQPTGGSFSLSANGAVTGTFSGAAFTAAADTPAHLAFLSESGAATLTLCHIRIEALDEAAPDPSASETSGTSTPSVTDGYRVQLDIREESPRYTTTQRTDSWEVPRNSTSTLEIIFSKVYKGTEIADWTPYLAVYANGVSLTPAFSYSPVVDQNGDVTASMSFVVTDDTTITGTIHHPSYGKFVAKLNGQIGVGGVSGGLDDVRVCTSQSLLFDQVYLSFYDSDCRTYGVTWHTYRESPAPVLEYVEGTATAADFAHATSVAASGSMVDSGYIYADYDPLQSGFFTTTERVDGVPDYTYKAHLPPLKPAAVYSYRVGDANKGEYSRIYTFTTRNAETAGFTFGYLSDSQWSENDASAGTKYKSVLDSMLGVSDVSFLMHGGDMVDVVNAVHLWGNQMGANSPNFFASIPTFAATGNHDSATAVLDHFALDTDTAWYSFDYQNVHFIVLDNGTAAYDVHLGDEQLAWLRNDLAEAKTKNYDWTIVSFHKPMYGPKQWNQNKDSYSVIAGDDGKVTRREELTDLFVEGGVDLVLQAHTHQYGRSYPITGVNAYQTDFTSSVSNGVTYFGNVRGPIYTVMSTACDKGDPAIGTAVGVYESSNGTTYYENDYMAISADGESGSFGVVSVEANRLTVSVYHDNTELYESFGIVK